MSKLSFKSFCIEYYAEHIGKPINEVYLLFKNEKLLELLDTDYDDLRGMGMEYLMGISKNPYPISKKYDKIKA